jgi:hypothetical protein
VQWPTTTMPTICYNGCIIPLSVIQLAAININMLIVIYLIECTFKSLLVIRQRTKLKHCPPLHIKHYFKETILPDLFGN